MCDNQKNFGKKTEVIQFNDTDVLLDIRYDHIFKAVFTKDTPASKGALSGLISAFIGRNVIVQTITANEPPAVNAFDRRIRFDIACKAETGELINIEMSFNPEPDELYRVEYYIGRHYSGQDIHGTDKEYTDLVETYQITIIGKIKFFNDDVLVHTFLYYDPEHTVSLGGKTRIITVELPKTAGIVDKPITELGLYEKWSIFFEYLTNNDKRGKINEILAREERIAMAGETLIHISQNEIEQVRLTDELKNILDHQSSMARARREGLAEGRREIAGKLKAAGVSGDVIFQATGLKPEEL